MVIKILKKKELIKTMRKWLYASAAWVVAIVLMVTYEKLPPFTNGMTYAAAELPMSNENLSDRPEVEVPVDLKAELGDQRNVDAGHSPWKLDAVFVSQVFVSLKISPEGIKGDYPVKYEDFKVIKNTGTEAVVEVTGSKTPIRRVYLKKLIRKDVTGVWTVVGYDPVKNKGEPNFKTNDFIFIPNVRKVLSERILEVDALVISENKVHNIALNLHEMTDNELQVLLSGCLINYNKKELKK